MRKNKLETRSIGKLMFEMCSQTTFSIMLYSIYMITDTLYVSKGVGSIASGAIGILSPVLVFINGVSSTLGTGGGSIISRKLGEKDQINGKAVVGCMMWMWLFCSLIITVTSIIFLSKLLDLLGCTQEIRPYALEYGRIILLSTVVSTGFSGIMRAEGDIFFSTLQWVCPVIINVILDPLFIYVLHVGIAGAAFATLLAQIFSMGMSIYYFFIRKSTPCRITYRDIRWNKQIGKEILYIGIPAFFSSMGNGFIGVACNNMLNQVGGTQAISTFTIISRIQSFLTTPFSGIMQGIQPMLGFDWGRKQIKRVKQTVFYSIRFSLIYGGFITICCYFGAEQILSMFTDDVEIIHMGESALQIICLSFIVSGIMLVIQAYFQSIGNGKKVMVLFLFSIFVIRLPLILVAGETMNFVAMWGSFVLSEYIIAGWSIYEYIRYMKGENLWKV